MGMVGIASLADRFLEGGLVALAVGGAAIAAAHPATDFALDLADEFLLDEIKKGWSPRLFLDDLRKLSKVVKEPLPSAKDP